MGEIDQMNVTDWLQLYGLQSEFTGFTDFDHDENGQQSGQVRNMKAKPDMLYKLL